MLPLGLDHWTSLFSLLFRFHCVVGYVFLNEHNHYRLSLAWKLHMPSVLSARKDSSTCVTKRSPLSCHCWKSFVIQRRQLARRFARCSKIFERCPVNKHTHTNEVFGARHPFYPICTPGLSLARPPAHVPRNTHPNMRWDNDPTKHPILNLHTQLQRSQGSAKNSVLLRK